VDALLERDTTRVLFGEGHAPERHSEFYPRWERSLFSKLKRLVGDPSRAVGPRLDVLQGEGQRPERLTLPPLLADTALLAGEPASQVWLLAASLGGPEAVKAFLDALPGGLPVGFIYAQHIEASFESALSQAVGRHSQWQVRQVRAGEPVRCGEVVIAPIAEELGFHSDGTTRLNGRCWPEPYSPSIDQMMLNLAQQFGERCGVIAFSGMGSDGSAAAAYVLRQGGRSGPSVPTPVPARACRTTFAKVATAPTAVIRVSWLRRWSIIWSIRSARPPRLSNGIIHESDGRFSGCGKPYRAADATC
jgi:Chemotaxis response regulator containing a CheY-like receiver domain and a methylesterase domain